MQNHARRNGIAIDELAFDFHVLPEITEDCKEGPESGCYITGLFLEGAYWDVKEAVLMDARPKQLVTPMPVIWLRPERTADIPNDVIFCSVPVYKTAVRRGTLTTTGHSSNYVITINLPSLEQETYWILRGIALLCSFDP